MSMTKIYTYTVFAGPTWDPNWQACLPLGTSEVNVEQAVEGGDDYSQYSQDQLEILTGRLETPLVPLKSMLNKLLKVAIIGMEFSTQQAAVRWGKT